MKVFYIAGLGVLMTTAAMAQVGQRENATPSVSDTVSNTQMEDCSITRRGDDYWISARSSFSWGASNPGIAVEVTSASGGVPTVQAHAITTGGAVAQERAAPQACGLRPGHLTGTIPANLRDRAPAPVAQCSVSSGPNGGSWDFSVPVSVVAPGASSSIKFGHVSIIKRGASPGNGTIIAHCDSTGAGQSAKGTPLKASYDLATGKK